MFETLHTTYKKIITCIGIVGYLEEDIIKRGVDTNKNLELNCLYAYPSKELSGLNTFTYQMMFPDNDHKIPCPKFFTLTLTNQQAQHSYLYCLKFHEKYSLKNDKKETTEIDIPLVIFIKSEKQDLESFKELLHLVNFIIVNDDLEKDGYLNYSNINDYKKVQLMNLFYFIFSLPHTSPHSQVKLKLNKEIKNSPFDSIDFYFSSNCEIPCNKNDTDINILFLILDQSIIIKALFAILSEKQIIFRASQAYLLHLIIPAILKLIFPFKWLQSCITILPKEKLDLLEAPGSFIFGVLSYVISLQELMKEYPGKIIIDCDTNEILGDSYLEPFEPPKYIPPEIQKDEKDKKKKDKYKKDKDSKDIKEILNNVNTGNNLAQGNNLLNIEGSYLYKYDNSIKKDKFFKENNHIIIDTQKSQLLVDKTNTFIDSNELKSLRRNLQLVRNPEIFDLENINNKQKKKSLNEINLNENEEENIILPNRAFSYNIQNIFMKFITNKLSNPESEFMSIFKNTNLFLAYAEEKKYQNNSGKRIFENIVELKNQERTLDNCFNIEYSLQKFKTQTIINIIDEKLSENNRDINEENKNSFDKIKTVLNNYIQIRNGETPENLNNYEDICESDRHERKGSVGIKDYGEMRKPFGRITKNFTKRHERNKTSVLQETFSGNNKFLLMGVDNSVKGVFKFYKENGFLEFINIFENFLKEEKINIKDELYINKINEQIRDIILKNEDFFNKINTKNNNNTRSLKKKDTITDKDKKKNIQMPIIPEFDKEEEAEEVNLIGRETVIQKNDGEDYDFSKNIMDNMVTGLNLNLEDLSDNKLNNGELDKYLVNDEDIISFPNLNEEINENNNNTTQPNDEIVNHKTQYYLFIAFILEDILEDKEKSEKLIEIINNTNNTKFNIKSLLLKIYRLSYKYSGLKHRDFPYFSYYNFLSSLNLEQLNSLKEEFNDITIDEIGLYEIIGNTILEKEKEKQREENKKKLRKADKNRSKSKDKKIDESKKNKENNPQPKKGEKDLLDIAPSMNTALENNQSIKLDNQKLDGNNSTNDLSQKSVDNSFGFNYLHSYSINSTEEFECKNENIDWTIIKNIAQEISNILPKKKDNNITLQDILEETHSKLIENKKLLNLIGQLKNIDLGKICLLNDRICFWLNCFNYLILFTMFYKKWNINNERDWTYFFENVKFLIGGNYYTFNDMQYILFKKILFFPNTYKVNDSLKKIRVSKADDGKNLEKKYSLLYNPFLVYLPIKGFIKPIIFDENQLESQFNQRTKDYLNTFIYFDAKNNGIIIPQLLNDNYPKFINGEMKTYQSFINPQIYNLFKEKKTKYLLNKYEWKLCFDSLFE